MESLNKECGQLQPRCSTGENKANTEHRIYHGTSQQSAISPLLKSKGPQQGKKKINKKKKLRNSKAEIVS